MLRDVSQATAACLVTMALCAFAYPAATWALGWAVFPKQAEGSLITRDGVVVGSRLIGQPFTSERYFHPRPSAAGANGYDAAAASGSNLGTTNPALRERVEKSLDELHATSGNPAPADLVTASGSGLDPHISPEAAHFQEARVARARNLPVDRVRDLIDRHVETSGAAIGAPPRVNVLLLNLALDEEAQPGATSAR